MKNLASILFVLCVKAPVFSQVLEELPFKGFRGNRLLAYNSASSASEKIYNKKRNVILQNEGNSYFVIMSALKQKTALYDQDGVQLRVIDLSEGENHIELSEMPEGVFLLRDLKTGRLLSELVHTK